MSRRVLVLVFIITLVSLASRAQNTVSLGDTTTWMTDFLEAHGCAAQTFNPASRYVRPRSQSWCSKILQSKSCLIIVAFNGTYMVLYTGSQSSMGSLSATVDLGDIDQTQITAGKAASPHDEMNQVNLVSKDHKHNFI
jgi:hypothetical protein